jgi:hypothetical protein
MSCLTTKNIKEESSMEKNVMEVGELFARILAVKSEDYIEPEKSKGMFELTGHLMNDFEKKVFTVFRQLHAEINQISKEMEEGRISKNEMGKANAEINVLRDKAHSVKQLFYFFISDRIKMWGCSIGVSKGWKIIIPDMEVEGGDVSAAIHFPREFNQFLEALKNALGGMNKVEDENTSTVSAMVRNMMQQNGNKTVH